MTPAPRHSLPDYAGPVTAADVHGELSELVRPLRRAEYDQLVLAGAFEDERIELLDGVLVEMSPEGTEHAWVIQLLNRHLARGLPDHLALRVAAPWAASDRSEPEPDLAIIPAGDYRRDHPDEAVLVIEVSRSSLVKDLGLKARIYAAAGVPEYWVIDVEASAVHRHTEPSPEGYRSVERHGASATLDAAGVPVRLDELFG